MHSASVWALCIYLQYIGQWLKSAGPGQPHNAGNLGNLKCSPASLELRLQQSLVRKMLGPKVDVKRTQAGSDCVVARLQLFEIQLHDILDRTKLPSQGPSQILLCAQTWTEKLQMSSCNNALVGKHIAALSHDSHIPRGIMLAKDQGLPAVEVKKFVQFVVQALIPKS